MTHCAAAGRCSSYQQGMASFLPTEQVLIVLPWLTGREPSDPALGQLFDRLVLRGNLAPWLSGWWELIRWDEVVETAQTSYRKRCSSCALIHAAADLNYLPATAAGRRRGGLNDNTKSVQMN